VVIAPISCSSSFLRLKLAMSSRSFITLKMPDEDTLVVLRRFQQPNVPTQRLAEQTTYPSITNPGLPSRAAKAPADHVVVPASTLRDYLTAFAVLGLLDFTLCPLHRAQTVAPTAMPPMRIAIAGTCGLAQYIANAIATQSYHNFIVLSRNVSTSSISYDAANHLSPIQQ
jgi:hypothetical protein